MRNSFSLQRIVSNLASLLLYTYFTFLGIYFTKFKYESMALFYIKVAKSPTKDRTMATADIVGTFKSPWVRGVYLVHKLHSLTENTKG